METPFAALARFNQAATPIPVRVTLRSGAFVDAVALGGDDDGLLIAESATEEPKTIATADITAVTVRERSHPRTLLVFIALFIAGFALLNAIIELPFVAQFLSRTWVVGGISFFTYAFVAQVYKVPYLQRLVHPWRDLYREPTADPSTARHR